MEVPHWFPCQLYVVEAGVRVWRSHLLMLLLSWCCSWSDMEGRFGNGNDYSYGGIFNTLGDMDEKKETRGK